MDGGGQQPRSSRRGVVDSGAPPAAASHVRQRRPGGRDLKTAREVLKVLRLLEQRGVLDAQEVSREVGKSHATATYLLNSLVAEGFAVRDPSGVPGRYCLIAKRAIEPGGVARPSPGLEDSLANALRELYQRTRERSYLAVLEKDLIVVADAVGRQGLARIPGLAPVIRSEAHCLAIGKVILAELGLEEWRARTGQSELPGFTAASITDPRTLQAELEAVRSLGFALDRQEFAEVTCCVAAPIRDRSGRLVASLGVSVPAGRFPAVQERFIAAVRDVCRQASTPEESDSQPPSPTKEGSECM
jgi:DNA-binding IclR family transcriptional regulator